MIIFEGVYGCSGLVDMLLNHNNYIKAKNVCSAQCWILHVYRDIIDLTCMDTWIHLRLNHLDIIAWTHSSCIPIIYNASSCITCLFIMWKCTHVVGSMWQLSLAVSCYMCREQEWWILTMWSLPAAGRWRFGRLFKLVVVVVVRNIYNIIQNINLHFLTVRNRHDQTN